MSIESLPQELVTIEDRDYLITAMPCTKAMQLQEELRKNSFLLSPLDIKTLVTKYVALENKNISDGRFDIIFARKTKHLQMLVEEVLKFNYPDLFDSLEEGDGSEAQ